MNSLLRTLILTTTLFTPLSTSAQTVLFGPQIEHKAYTLKKLYKVAAGIQEGDIRISKPEKCNITSSYAQQFKGSFVSISGLPIVVNETCYHLDGDIELQKGSYTKSVRKARKLFPKVKGKKRARAFIKHLIAQKVPKKKDPTPALPEPIAYGLSALQSEWTNFAIGSFESPISQDQVQNAIGQFETQRNAYCAQEPTPVDCANLCDLFSQDELANGAVDTSSTCEKKEPEWRIKTQVKTPRTCHEAYTSHLKKQNQSELLDSLVTQCPDNKATLWYL